MHYIVEGDLPSWCDWLGVEIEDAPELLSPVFSAETLAADLLVRVGRRQLLHAEYIRTPKADMYFRMLRYRAAIMNRYRGMSLIQYAIVLGTGRLRYHDDPAAGFTLGLRTIYLPKVDPAAFLSYPGLAALADLAKGDQQTRARSALNAIQQIRTLPEERQSGLFEAMINLATISLDPHTIDLIRKETGMTVDSIAEFYSHTEVGAELQKRGHERGLEQGLELGLEQGREEGREEGREQGRAEGREQGLRKGLNQGTVRTLSALLRARFGDQLMILAVATQLAQSDDLDSSVRAIETAATLDDLIAELSPFS
jgi:hypothetical protein